MAKQNGNWFRRRHGVLALFIAAALVLIAVVLWWLVADGGANRSSSQDSQQSTTSQTNSKAQSVAQTYPSGTYQVGSELPAGEYRLVAEATTGYFVVSTNRQASRDAIVTNGNFPTNSILSVNKGQYVTLTSVKAYPIGSSPKVDTAKQGMFKIGVDVPAGTYKIAPSSSAVGYVEIYSDSSHLQSSLISNDIVTSSTTVTLAAGQYVTLNQAHIVK
jgi:hypothetical protein